MRGRAAGALSVLAAAGACWLGPAALYAAEAKATHRSDGARGPTCIGRTCGRALGFRIEHCHRRPGADPHSSDVCWAATFDGACEALGYTVPVDCPRGGTLGLAAAGQTASSLPTAVGGFSIFSQQILHGLEPRPPAAGGDGEGEGGAYFSEVTTSVERDAWSFAGRDGETTGARFTWRREGEQGLILGAAGSYLRAAPARGESEVLSSASGSAGSLIGASAFRWSVNATASRLSGLLDLTLYGGGAQLYFNRELARGAAFNGGLTVQYSATDEQGFEDVTVAGGGLSYGLPLGRRLTANLEAYAVTVLEPRVEDDLFYTLGAQLGLYLSPRLSLTLGYRLLGGIAGLESDTLTFGGSTRF